MTDSRTRVLIVHPSDELYGADKVILEVVAALPVTCVVEVWLPKDVNYPGHLLSKALVEQGVDVRFVHLPVLRRSYARARYLPVLAWRFLVTGVSLLRHRPRLVYVNTAALAPVLPLARLTRARTLLHLHELLDDGQARAITPFFRYAQRIVSVSAAVQQSLPRVAASRSTVVHNGFDLPTPVALPAGPPIRFLVASRWNAWKGHEALLAAWDLVESESVELVVLGAPPPNGEKVDVPTIVAGLRHPETVSVLGETSDVRAVIDGVHVVIVPSTRPDPLPTIAIEATAAGRPVIASNSGGLPEIVSDQVTGWLVHPADSVALAKAIDTVTLGAVARMSASARAKYETDFTREAFRNSFSVVIAKEIALCRTARQ